MTGKVVTGFDFDISIVTIDVPHGDLLTALATTLGRWQDAARRLDGDMAVLRGHGVFLDPDGRAVVPGWWERTANGRHVAWYMVWSRKHARRTGCNRRQYVKAAKVEGARARARRTQEYRDLAAQRERVETQIARMGRELARIVEEFGMVTKKKDDIMASITTQPDDGMVTRPARRGDHVVTTRPNSGVVTETLALGSGMGTIGDR